MISEYERALSWAQLSYTNGAAPQQFTRTTLDGLGRTIKVERGPTGANSVGAAVSVVDTEYAPCACSPIGKVKRVSQPYEPGKTVYWTTYTYDGEGRTLTVTGPDGASQAKMTYNAQATGVSIAPPSTGSSVTAVDPKGNWKIVTSDVFGNTIQVTEPNPANAAQPLKTYYQYDKVDHLTLVSMPRNGDLSTACPAPSQTCQSRTFVYDPATLKMTSERHPETQTTTYQYQPGSHSEMLLLNKTDAKLQTTKIDLIAYDKYNRVTTVKFFDAAGTEDPCQRTVYTYDTYPSGVGTGLGGGWGRRTASQVGPSDNTASCAAKSDATGRWNQWFVQAYGYTGVGQITLKRLIFNQIQTDSNGTAGAPTSKTWDTSYGYDDGGYQTSVTYPMGQTHLIGLDFMRRPNTLTYMRPGFTIPGPTISGVTYNAADQMTSMTWPANPGSTVDPDAYTYPAFTETRTYNSFNQVLQIQTQNSAGTPTIVDLNYLYGAAGQNNGQVTSVASGLDTNFNSVFTYDQLNRLTGVTGTKNQTYGYDGWGNLTSKSGDGLVFTSLIADPLTNRLADQPIPPQPHKVCYDPNGNLISITTACNNPEYSYDIQNRLVGVVVTHSGSRDISNHLDQSAERYYYTADNKRVSTARPNGNPGQAQVFYVYGAKGEIAATCTSYVFGDAPTCDGREPRDVKFAGRMVIQNFVPVAVDRLGSVVANPTQGSVGSTAAKYYAPFGEQYNEAVSGTVFPGNTNFATYFHEETTGLNYADQRFYNSQYGRFMNADPYKAVRNGTDPTSPRSFDKYAYAEGDPIRFYDPKGLIAEEPGPDPDLEFEPAPEQFKVPSCPMGTHLDKGGKHCEPNKATEPICEIQVKFRAIPGLGLIANQLY